MSNALVSELYESRSIDARLQRVLVVLCDHANRDGFLWPSVGRIAWYLEISESTVHRSMRALEAMGVLEVRRRPGRSSMYRINLDVLPAKEPYRGPKEPDEWKKYANQANSNPCQNDTPTPVKMTPLPLSKCHPTPVNLTPITVTNPKQNPISTNVEIEPAKNRKRSIPADFKVTINMYETAVGYGIPPDRVDFETDRFRDHAAAKGTKHVDWVAAWRTWMRRAVDWTYAKQKPGQQSPEAQNAATDSVIEQTLREMGNA